MERTIEPITSLISGVQSILGEVLAGDLPASELIVANIVIFWYFGHILLNLFVVLSLDREVSLIHAHILIKTLLISDLLFLQRVNHLLMKALNNGPYSLNTLITRCYDTIVFFG